MSISMSMSSYSVYLELLYEDLLASAGITLPPCTTSDNNAGSSSSSATTDGNADEEGGYCQGYNLMMTSQVRYF